MKLLNHKKSIQIDKRVISLISSVVILGLIIILSSCARYQLNNLPQTDTIIESTQTEANAILLMPTETPTKMISPTQTPVPSKTMDPIYDLHITVDVTQGPIIISTITPKGNNYLYENANVTVNLGNSDIEEYAYINLDDLNDNEMKKSDVRIEMYSGSDGVDFELHPINSAYFYYSDKNTLDYESCLKKFPLAGFTKVDYDNQGTKFLNGKSYCVLTNEGRIAIVGFVKNSIKFNADHSRNLSVLVTVYSN
jgi:hypothetical protein